MKQCNLVEFQVIVVDLAKKSDQAAPVDFDNKKACDEELAYQENFDIAAIKLVGEIMNTPALFKSHSTAGSLKKKKPSAEGIKPQNLLMPGDSKPEGNGFVSPTMEPIPEVVKSTPKVVISNMSTTKTCAHGLNVETQILIGAHLPTEHWELR